MSWKYYNPVNKSWQGVSGDQGSGSISENTVHNAPGFGGDGPSGPQIEIPTDKYPKSYSGSKPWLEDYAKGLSNRFGSSFLDAVSRAITRVQGASPYEAETKTASGQMMSALDNLKNAPTWIEEQRQIVPKLFLESQPAFERTLQPVLESYNAKGILDSGVTGGALSAVIAERNRQYNQAIQEANLAASSMNLDFQMQHPEIAGNVTNVLNNLDRYWLAKEAAAGQLGSSGQSLLNQILQIGGTFSESSNEWAPWATTLPLTIPQL